MYDGGFTLFMIQDNGLILASYRLTPQKTPQLLTIIIQIQYYFQTMKRKFKIKTFHSIQLILSTKDYCFQHVSNTLFQFKSKMNH